MNDIPCEIIDSIECYCQKNKEIECCGIIYQDRGASKWLPCENLAKNKKHNFILNPRFFVDYDVQYVVHSHCFGSARPSVFDKQSQHEICIPYLIYSVEHNNFCIYENISV